METIRILHTLARAGATLVCKCLGCMENTILLSEVHPLSYKVYNALFQARQWHNLLRPEDTATDFVGAIGLIAKRCDEAGKKLIIRDWSHLDFIAVPFLEKATYQPIVAEMLAAFKIIHLSLVRNPIDQWLSTDSLAVLHDKLSLEEFLLGYAKFAEYSASAGFVRYEDFVAEPIEQTKIICEILHLDYDETFIQKWHNYRFITGDIKQRSRGGKLDKIQYLPRLPISSELLDKFYQNNDYQRAIKLLNY